MSVFITIPVFEIVLALFIEWGSVAGEDSPNITVCQRGEMYQDGGCFKCKKGTYQSEGHTSCTPCPDGYSTDHIGSFNVSDCTEDDIGDDSLSTGSIVGIVSGVVVPLVSILTFILTFYMYKRNKARANKKSQKDDNIDMTPNTSSMPEVRPGDSEHDTLLPNNSALIQNTSSVPEGAPDDSEHVTVVVENTRQLEVDQSGEERIPDDNAGTGDIQTPIQCWDVMILYTEDDLDAALTFRDHLINDIDMDGEEKISAVLYDQGEVLALRGSTLSNFEFACDRSSFVFIFLTKILNEDDLVKFYGEMAVTDAIGNKVNPDYAVPVYTEKDIKTSRITSTMALRSIRGIEYYRNDNYYRTNIATLIKSKRHTLLARKNKLNQ